MKTKLKTLKDLEKLKLRRLGDYESYLDLPKHFQNNEIVVSEKDLKKEAIKRARYYKEQRDTHPKNSVDWYFSQGKMGAELFAHDIKEEDLN